MRRDKVGERRAECDSRNGRLAHVIPAACRSEDPGVEVGARSHARDARWSARMTRRTRAATGGQAYLAGGTQMPRSCMSFTCRLMTLSRYSWCFIGARFR
jgi:hypothetical protein